MRGTGLRSVVLLAGCVLAFGGLAQDDEGLRGVFVGKAEPSAPDRVVGRMAIRLRREDGTWERVRADHPFRSGDRFRFEVESNHDGRLVILHRPLEENEGGQHGRPSGEAFEELWPADSGQEPRLVAHEARVAPDADKAFIFDEEVGREHFYVAIADAAEKSLVSKGKQEIVNFVLRGLEEEVHTRSARATYSDDLWLYFGPSEEDERYLAVLELRLRHEPAAGE